MQQEYAVNVSIGAHWEAFVEELVRSGRFGSASEVIRHGLRQVEADELRLRALRESVTSALAEDEWYSADEVVDDIARTLHEAPASFDPQQ